MSDHDFEQQVRQKLADLKLTPSPTAWEKIESGLRSYRRPRTYLMWAALLLFVVGGSYLVYQLTGGDHLNAPQTVVQPETIPHAETPAAATTPHPSATAPEGVVGDRSIPDAPNGSSHPSSAPARQSRAIQGADIASIQSNAPVPGDVARELGVAESPVVQPEAAPGRDAAAQPSTPVGIPDDQHEPAAESTTNDRGTTDAIRPQRQEVPADDDKENNDPGNSEIFPGPGITGNTGPAGKKPAEETPEPAAEKQQDLYTDQNPQPHLPALAGEVKKRDLKKWSFAVTAFSGASTVKEGIKLFDLNLLNLQSEARVQDVSERPQFSAPSVSAPNINNPIPNAIPSYTPSSIAAGFSYGVGLEAKRQLSDRIALSAGIRYLQLNTHTKVGRRQYGSQIVNNGSRGYLYVSSYFTVEPEQTDYRNRYHFIDLPVELQLRLNNRKSLPVYWDAGLVVSQLLGSNSLHFDGTTGVYYQDDNLLNRTQLAASTGFSIGLLNKTAVPLVIGPTIRYHLSEILQKEVAGSKHFSSLGLQLKVLLK